MDVPERIDRITTIASNSPSGRRVIVKGYAHGGKLLAKARYPMTPTKENLKTAIEQFVRYHGIAGTFHRTPADATCRTTLTRFSPGHFVHFS